MSHRVFIILLVLFLTGCATVSRPLGENEAADEKYAYIYGRFKQEGDVGWGIVLGIKDRKSSRSFDTYGLKFDQAGDVTVIKVLPGQYEFSKFNYVNGLNEILRTSEFKNSDLGIDISLEPNKAYYIGDWTGTVSSSSYYGGTSIEWKIDSVENNMTSSTARFKEKYSKLATLENIGLYSPSYSAGFDREDPSTYNENDLRLAMKYGEYDLAHIMVNHLKESSRLAEYYGGVMLARGRGVAKDENTGIGIIRRLANEDKLPEAMSYMAATVLDFVERNKERLPEEKRKKLNELAFHYLLGAAVRGHSGSIKFLCRMSKPDQEPMDNLNVFFLSWCGIKQRLAENYEEFKTEEPIDLVSAMTRFSEEQKIKYDKSYKTFLDAMNENKSYKVN